MTPIFKSAIISVICILSLANTALAQHRESLYGIIVYRDGFAGFGEKNYKSIQVYLNNNSNDTLYYRGADCNNLLFSIKSNPWFHLAGDVCDPGKYIKATLPPHRSQKMELYLTMDKVPDHDVLVLINMKIYKWENGAVKDTKEESILGDFYDSTVLHYGANHQAYWTNEAKVMDQKEKSILPDKNIHLLTDNDRNMYRLTVENTRISTPRDTMITTFNHIKPKKAKVVTVPVKLYNNGNDTLKFYSMTCSWYDFFGTNQSGISIPVWGCAKNVPTTVVVAPHKTYRKNLTIVYDHTIKSGTRYRISMSLLKDTGNLGDTWNYWTGEFIRFNKIWSNGIIVQ
jgi:hypothetical protein